MRPPFNEAAGACGGAGLEIMNPRGHRRHRRFFTGDVTMTEGSSANAEVAIVLPLGIVANQLMRIEAQLRLLNMKTLDFATERDQGRHIGLIVAKLEQINEALDSISGLVSDIEEEIHPTPQTPSPADDSRSSADVVYRAFANRKRSPDQDD